MTGARTQYPGGTTGLLSGPAAWVLPMLILGRRGLVQAGPHCSPAAQADGMAGAALFGAAPDGELVLETGDQEELASGLVVLGDETPWTSGADHGDSFERIRYFDEGRLHGIARCVPEMKFGGWNGGLVCRSRLRPP